MRVYEIYTHKVFEEEKKDKTIENIFGFCNFP